MKLKSNIARFSVLAAAMALAGCANFSGISPVATPRSADSFGLTQGKTAAVQPAADWWRAFGDEQLNALIAQALEGNPNLRVAQARLARAQAVTEVAKAATLPQVGAGIDINRQKYSANGLYPPPLAGATLNSGNLQLTASWELDFFGKNRAALDAALSTVQAAQADTDAARILLATNVARSYFQLARYNDQIAVARRTLSQREESNKLVRDRVNAGLDTNLELRQSEGSLPEARQQVEALMEQAALAQNALAALTGQGNRQPVATQPTLAGFKPAVVPTELPADLLGARADIVAARWRIEAAGQDVKSAKAQFYPNINIVAFVGFNSLGLSRLVNSGSEQWGVGPAIRLPIFDAGRLRANLRGKTSDLDAAIETYNAAILDAIHETADQIASSQSIAKQQREQRDAQTAAEGAYEIATQRYRAGLGTYLNVLTAETSVLNQRRLAVDLAARSLDTQVQLIRAIGGGWRPAGAGASNTITTNTATAANTAAVATR